MLLPENSNMTRTARTMMKEYPETQIFFGEDALDSLCTELGKKSCRKVLLFAGGSSERSAVLSRKVLDKLSGKGISGILHDRICPEPAVEDVRKMVRSIPEETEGLEIIAVGGGSVMDAAKAAWLSYQTGRDVCELFGVNIASGKEPRRSFRKVLCVPTTSGTGSEATPYSNIVDPSSGVKKLIVEKEIIPSAAFVDPALTMSMSQTLTSVTALDALVHCVESVLNYRASDAHKNAQEWGIEGVRLIVKGLPMVRKNLTDPEGRTLLSAAATLGGMCIKNRPTSLPHLCSFSFYGQVSHGEAVAALLIPFWRYYLGEERVREETMKLAGIFSPAKESVPEEVVANGARFIGENGGVYRLAELGCPESMIRKTAADAVLNPVKLQSCPRPLKVEEAEQVIGEILKKGW